MLYHYAHVDLRVQSFVLVKLVTRGTCSMNRWMIAKLRTVQGTVQGQIRSGCYIRRAQSQGRIVSSLVAGQ